MAAAIVVCSLLPAPAGAQVKCLDTPARCKHVKQVIRQEWPDASEEHAIVCFSNESGLEKWSNARESTQYKGIAQMGASEREWTNWRWRVLHQVRAALKLFQARGFSPWYAPGC